jgi:hypothetical protein
MLGPQADLFVQFPVHGLDGAFAILDATLRKLPRVLPNTFTPKNLVFLIYEDNADIRTVAFTV